MNFGKKKYYVLTDYREGKYVLQNKETLETIKVDKKELEDMSNDKFKNITVDNTFLVNGKLEYLEGINIKK